MRKIKIRNISKELFAPFGDLIDFDRKPDYPINNGMCDRYHALAVSETLGEDAKTAISLGRAKPYALPLELKMVERHPLGSQAFLPLGKDPFLVVVAKDTADGPSEPLAFVTEPGQGINYHRNTWHAVLTPLDRPADFIIVDRIGEGDNLEEYQFDEPWLVIAG